MDVSECIQPTLDGALIIEVIVQPSASRNGISGINDWRKSLNISVKAPANGGRANSALITVFATILEISKSSVEIISGHSSRKKRIRIEGISISELIGRLEARL